MAIHCPYCEHSISVRGAKPGRYSPKCPKCQGIFTLSVPPDPAGEMRVSRVSIEPTPTVAGVKVAAEAEAAQAGGTAGVAKAPAAPTATASADDPDATALGRAALGGGSSDPTQITGGPAINAEMAAAAAPPRPLPTADPKHGGPTFAAPAPAPGRGQPSAAADATVARPSGAPPKPAPPDATALGRAGPAGGAPASGAPAVSSPARHQAASAAEQAVARTLGGYEVIKQLGRGGMGAVFLARQVSLDRNVALKTMHPQWAGDPQFVSRFTREAYAAAQLVHHNVVQIYDIGVERDTNFFSMEFVEGNNIGDLVKAQGKLDPEVAVGYVLQAARGLRFAHDQGMVHRDIKPDNLMVNRHGVVKVADLGLVKTPGSGSDDRAAPSEGGGQFRGVGSKLSAAAASSATQASVAMGTPAYMAPEQAVDAATVDARADIYSLGCTLYVMVTGRPVHEGTTAVEVMTKHQTEPIVPPDVVVKRVPKELSAIVLKMTAKRPEERYQNMGEVIAALEGFLGIQSAGPFTPREEHAAALEDAVGRFNASAAAKRRGLMIKGFFAACSALMVLFAVTGALGWVSGSLAAKLAGGVLGLEVLATIGYQSLIGVTQKTHLFSRARQLAFGARVVDWLIWAAGLAVVVVLLDALDLFLSWTIFCVFAAGLAAGFHFLIDRRAASEREKPLAETEEMLKGMRLRGLEENALRQFVCKYSGERWEEFYESLFGYESKLTAREQWGKGPNGRPRKKHASWRDPIVAWIDGKLRHRREAREKRMLQKMEEKALRAKGVGEAEAKRKAEMTAAIMVDKAAELRVSAAQHASDPAATVAPGGKTVITARSLVHQDDDATRIRERQRVMANTRRGQIMGLLLGRRMRFAAGVVLLAACVLWMRQNGVITGEEKLPDTSNAEVFPAQLAEQAKAKLSRTDTKPLHVPVVSSLLGETVMSNLFNSFASGAAGLILLLSAFIGERKLSLVVYPAAAVALAGPWAWSAYGGGVRVPIVKAETQETARLLACVVVGWALTIFGWLFVRR